MSSVPSIIDTHHTPAKIIERYNVLRTENEVLRAELKDSQDNLALANAEVRNLRRWQEVTEHMMQ
ncbi:MAG: hypothetical protein QFB87_05070 [Patescibacteria group bacterium]|nr:hypothetical protein [Patescibacteria group bacterium]